MLKWVVFDFADTLYDHNLIRAKLLENKTRSKILERFGLKRVSEDEIADLAENFRHSMKGRIERHDPTLLFKKIGILHGVSFTEKQLSEMSEIYGKEELKYFKLLPNAESVLKFLKKKKLNLALISNINIDRLNARLQKSGLKKCFKLIIISTEVGGEKSGLFPFMVFLARANKFVETKPEETLMIGDRLDEDGAAAILGMRTVILEGRSAKFAKFHGLQPDFKIRDLSELKRIINQLT
jgi:FMN phosphatase YigB (HAD superfamily)